NTKEIWFYDLRTDMESLGKRNPLSRKHFTDFVYAYTGGISIDDVRLKYDGTLDFKKREKINDPRWKKFTREEIASKNDSLDVGLGSSAGAAEGNQSLEPLAIAEQIKTEMSELCIDIE